MVDQDQMLFQSEQAVAIDLEDISMSASSPFPSMPEEGKRQDNGELEQESASDQYLCECTPKVLLVDDTSYNLIPLRKFISDGFGIECEEANNGLEAFEKFKAAYERECRCENRIFKLVLMDIQMPVMDGIESTKNILTYLKEKQAARGNSEEEQDPTHIVAITSYQVEQIRQQTKEAGMKDMFEKPISNETVHTMIWRHFLRLPEEQVGLEY